MATPFKEAKQKLEMILNRERELDWPARLAIVKDPSADCRYREAENGFFVRIDMPELLKKGSRQVVFLLNDSYVGKGYVLKEFPKHYLVYQYAARSRESYFNLKKLGFNVAVYHYFGITHEADHTIKLKTGGVNVAIAENLLRGSRFRLIELNEVASDQAEAFGQVINGQDLQKEFANNIELLTAIYQGKNPAYTVKFSSSHFYQGLPDKAFCHMFAVQVNNATNKGILFCFDLDHVWLYSKSQS